MKITAPLSHIRITPINVRPIQVSRTYDDHHLIYKTSIKAYMPMEEWLSLDDRERDKWAAIAFDKLSSSLISQRCVHCKREECFLGRAKERTSIPVDETGDVIFEVCCEQRVYVTETKNKMEWLALRLEGE